MAKQLKVWNDTAVPNYGQFQGTLTPGEWSEWAQIQSELQTFEKEYKAEHGKKPGPDVVMEQDFAKRHRALLKRVWERPYSERYEEWRKEAEAHRPPELEVPKGYHRGPGR